MELNNYLETIREFYEKEKFCDLKVIVLPDDERSVEESTFISPILCHSLVLVSAIPELRLCIPMNHENDEDFITLFVYNSSKSGVETAISDIYNVLAADSSKSSECDKNYSVSCHRRWIEAFGLKVNKEAQSRFQSQTEQSHNQLQSNTNISCLQPIKEESVSSKTQLTEGENHLSLNHIANEDEHKKQSLEDGKSLDLEDKNMPRERTITSENFESNKENDLKFIPNRTDCAENPMKCSSNVQSVDNRSPPSSNDTKQNIGSIETNENKDVKMVLPVKNMKKEYKERSCLDCNKTFPFNTKGQKSLYQEHISSHFKCDCNIAFGDRKAFKLHMKTIHRGKNGKTIQTISEDGVTKIKMKKDKPLFR